MKRFCFPATLLLLCLVIGLLPLSAPIVAPCWAGNSPALHKISGPDSIRLGDNQYVCDPVDPRTSCATNGFYKVYVFNNTDPWAGQYTVTTGVLHPAGPDLNVLAAGGFPGTSYLTLRVYSGPNSQPPSLGTEYIQASANPQDHLEDPGYSPLKSLGPYVVVQPGGKTAIPIGPTGFPTGFQTTYKLSTTGTPPAPDNMTIVQVVNVNGTTFEDSTVEVTTRVRNTGTADLNVGIRYRWDLAVGNDDGPTLQPYNDKPLGNILIDEKQYVNPLFVMYRIADNDMNPNPVPNPPTYYIFATNTGPDWVRPKPTPPALFQYACFYGSSFYAFDYHVDPSLCIASVECSTCTPFKGGDSVILYYFGETADQPVTVKAGEEVQVSESLLVTSEPEPPPPPHPPMVVPALSGLAMIGFFVLLTGIYAVFMSRKRKREDRS